MLVISVSEDHNSSPRNVASCEVAARLDILRRTQSQLDERSAAGGATAGPCWPQMKLWRFGWSVLGDNLGLNLGDHNGL